MRTALLMLVAAAIHAGVARTDAAPPSGAACRLDVELSIDSLRRIAERVHPELFAPANRANGSVVALVFDASCRLTEDAIGRPEERVASVNSVIARLIPAAANNDYVTSGFLEASAIGPASPWIVWGVLRGAGAR